MVRNQTRGLSKGCLIALIVGGVIVVLIIIALILVYVYREDLAKVGAGAMIAGVKTELAQHPMEGVDTVRFNAISDAFVKKMETEKLQAQDYAALIGTIQKAMEDKSVDADEADGIMDAMTALYPDLQKTFPKPAMPDSTMLDSTMMMDSMSSE